MKKYASLLLVVLLFAGILVACTGESTDLTISDPLQSQPTLEHAVRMVVTNSENAPPRVDVTIFNDSDYELITGVHFGVEMFDGAYWRNIPWYSAEGVFFADIGYQIDPDGSIEFTKDLNLVGTLESGLYRIRKQVFRDIDTPIHDSDLHDVVAEFHWEA